MYSSKPCESCLLFNSRLLPSDRLEALERVLRWRVNRSAPSSVSSFFSSGFLVFLRVGHVGGRGSGGGRADDETDNGGGGVGRPDADFDRVRGGLDIIGEFNDNEGDFNVGEFVEFVLEVVTTCVDIGEVDILDTGLTSGEVVVRDKFFVEMTGVGNFSLKIETEKCDADWGVDGTDKGRGGSDDGETGGEIWKGGEELVFCMLINSS